MPTLREVTEALAEAIRQVDLSGLLFEGTDELSVVAFESFSPSPPMVDIYPADPSAEDAGFGPHSSMQIWTVRARVQPLDEEGNQAILYALREPAGPSSLREAIHTDNDLDDLVEGLNVEWSTGFQIYRPVIGIDPSHQSTLLGCEWRVRCFVDSTDVS